MQAPSRAGRKNGNERHSGFRAGCPDHWAPSALARRANGIACGLFLITSAPGSGVATCQPRFSVGAPETVLTRQRLKEAGVGGIDASLYALNDQGVWKWFCTSGWRHTTAIGPRDNPFEKVLAKATEITGLPDAFADSKMGFSRDHLSGNISWIANVYRNPENGHILGFVHTENVSPDRSGVYFRLGLSISKDGGRTFAWCGFILEPELSYQTWFEHWRPKDFRAGFIYPNTGLANYIIKDGYFQLYYTDTRERPDSLVNGVAAARAKLSDVLAAAEDQQATPWRKYHDGGWDENGLGGRFTPLNIDPLGFLHGDAAYNSHLRQYVLVTRSYFHADGQNQVIGHDWNPARKGSILISFSQDGIRWCPWQTVHEDQHAHDYPSIVSTGDDNEVTGKSFWIYYKYFQDAELPAIEWHQHRWDRVLVTLE